MAETCTCRRDVIQMPWPDAPVMDCLLLDKHCPEHGRPAPEDAEAKATADAWAEYLGTMP